MTFLKRFWRALSPAERKRLRLAGSLTVGAIVSLLLRWLAASGAVAAIAASSALVVASQVEGEAPPPPGRDHARPVVPAIGHGPARDELPAELEANPVAAAKAAIGAQRAATKGTTGPDLIEDPKTLATPSQRGCRSGPFVGNFSSRNGARPAMLPLHITVSRNQPGWGDVDAIASWFAQSRSQASSNYVIDAEGHCAYIVNEANKAWTQGFFNPWSISIELIHFSTTDPNEPWPEAQLRKAALVFADASKRWGIPLRLVNPEGCNVLAGITDHDRLECGNTHVDVGTREAGAGVHQGTFPMSRFIRYVRRAAAPRVRFVLRDHGKRVARSRPVAPGGAAERRRLHRFLGNVEPHILERLRDGGGLGLWRVRVAAG